MNSLWRIAYSDYDFAIDRRTLTYSLTETKTGTVWADGLSVGWIELEATESGARTRYDFAQAKVVSVSEKSGYQGKRILFGLDLNGIPVDLYFICSQREIQLIVEATRDTRTHRVQDVGLFPGLVAVPDDGASYLVIPQREGTMLFAQDAPTAPKPLRIWDNGSGVDMPFVGAVRCVEGDVRKTRAALALITDSAYGRFMLQKGAFGKATLDTEYERDPERRRLDVRVIPLPEANHVAIARAYRDKIVGERNHVTLRKKLRDRPHMSTAIGTGFFSANYHLSTQTKFFDDLGVTKRIFVNDFSKHGLYFELYFTRSFTLTKACGISRWDLIEEEMAFREARGERTLIGTTDLSDWQAVTLDFWNLGHNSPSFGTLIPLIATVYHDSVIACGHRPGSDLKDWNRFFRALRNLAAPYYVVHPFLFEKEDAYSKALADAIQRTYAVLAPLQQLTFAAFLTEHRFLTQDRKVEEAVYSDKTRIVINHSETDDWQSDELHLPPLGFYVRHSQMEAHYALRVGETTFATRAWRIRRSQDGQPLEASGDVLEQEFAVESDG